MTMKYIPKLIILLSLMFVIGCGGENAKTTETAVLSQISYTCPMHPQVQQYAMGTCPVCGMDLVLVQKSANNDGLQLSDRQRTLANISTIAIGNAAAGAEKQLNGRLVANPDQTSFISSRVAGRLDRLFVRQTGEQVKKGQPLYQIYSEQLATLQQEFLLALAQAAQFPEDKIFARLLQSARQNLRLYGQSASQIRTLEQSRKVSPNITFFAAASGNVAELSVTEGQYVTEGSPILRLEGYASLWVEADIYASELGSIKEGQQLRVLVPGWEDEPQRVTVSFIHPALQPGSQLLQIRGVMPNPGGRWQPGLQAKVFVARQNTGSVITLPHDALIRKGDGAHLWVETKPGYFEPRVVEIGNERSGGVEVKSGLQEGDQVVVSGAYLLYSEYVLKKGKDPMAAVNKI